LLIFLSIENGRATFLRLPAGIFCKDLASLDGIFFGKTALRDEGKENPFSEETASHYCEITKTKHVS